MRWTDSSEGFAELRQWSEPIVFDRLVSAWRRLAPDGAQGLSRLHADMWRALIACDAEAFEAGRRAMAPAIRAAGLPPGRLAEVDAEILRELADVAASRTRRSPREAAAYRLALMDLARHLEPARAVAQTRAAA